MALTNTAHNEGATSQRIDTDSPKGITITSTHNGLLKAPLGSSSLDHYPQPKGYHGLGISINPPAPSDIRSFASPPSAAGKSDTDDRVDVVVPLNKDKAFVEPNDPPLYVETSGAQQESSHSFEKSMYAASNVALQGSPDRTTMTIPQFLNYIPSTEGVGAARTLEEIQDAADFWKICISFRNVVAQTWPEEDKQRLLTTARCCRSCGTPIMPVVFTPSRSFEILGAWRMIGVPD